MGNEEADRLREQLNELKHQLDDHKVALEQYENNVSSITTKQQIIYEMFKEFVKS